MLRLLCTTAFLAFSTPVLADDVIDTLNSAMEAYQQGDIAYALDEIAYATQLLQALKSGNLTALLPEALASWSRTIDEDEGRALGMMGGTGAVAVYTGGDREFRVQVTVDSPMVAMFAGAFGNATMLASMGKVERVGRERFLNQDGELTGVIGGRILVQATGGDPAVMIEHLATIDFDALKAFGN
jgi:hypothetical protein